MGKRQTHSQTPQPRTKKPAPRPQQATTKHTQTEAHKDTANTRQKNTEDPQKKQHPRTTSKIPNRRAQTGPTAPTTPPPQPRRGPRHTDTRPARKTPNPPTYHLPKHTNQDIARRQSKDKDSTANKTEHKSKRNPTGKPRQARQTAKSTRPPPSHQ